MDDEFFSNRKGAGKKLAGLLMQYRRDAVVFALPRGGVVVGAVVAEQLKVPLEIVIAKKIGHPLNTEFAIGAVSLSGLVISDSYSINEVDQEWLKFEVNQKRKDIVRAMAFYEQKSFPHATLSDRIALIIDDSVATGSTMLAAIQEVYSLKPKKLIVGIPVISKEALTVLGERADEVVAVIVPEYFLGAVGAYYYDFEQIDDIEVIKLLKRGKKRYERTED